jgi:hypothetical protein
MKLAALALTLAPVTVTAQNVWDTATPPPITAVSALPGFTIPSHCAFVMDDPHIFSFDNRKIDCQGSGDYILSIGKKSEYEIQGRFTLPTPAGRAAIMKANKGAWEPGSVNTAVVIKTGHPEEPIIEVDASKVTFDGKTWNENFCEMQYRINGTLATLTSADATLFNGAVNFQRRHSNEKDFWSNNIYTQYYRNFFFRKSGLFVQLMKRYDGNYGCYFNVRICLPSSIKNLGVMGILGNADGVKSNDFMTRLAAPLPDLSYDKYAAYCLDNWCVPAENSMFATPNPNGQCQAKYDAILDAAVKNADPKIKEICMNDEDCIYDAIVTGDVAFGRQTLNDKMAKDNPVVKIDPDPVDNVEKDTCKTPEGKEVACDDYDLDLKCEAMGYDFGYRMSGCQSLTAKPFSQLEITDKSPTCVIGNYNYGVFDMACKTADGTGFREATIKTSVDSAIKLSGAGGKGTLYQKLAPNQPYTLKTSAVTPTKIEDIEFCFKCPTEIVNNQLITCAADVKKCADGTTKPRDPLNKCEFPSTCVTPIETNKITVPPTSPPGTCSGSHTCSCFKCNSVKTETDGSLSITVGHCKDESISWMCCAGVDGGRGNCAVTAPCKAAKCEGIAKGAGLTVNVPCTAKTFTINTHDGKTVGNAMNVQSVCGGPPGGQGGSCTNPSAVPPITAHCLIDFDIVRDCGYVPPKATAAPTNKPTASPTPGPTVKPTASPTPGPTAMPTPGPTTKPTPVPTAGPTAKPTASPTAKPTPVPTPGPTTKPTASPTAKPTSAPTPGPTTKPTASPTAKPTPVPTPGPTTKPTASPTAKPTSAPTPGPTSKPTASPTAKPTGKPTVQTAPPTPKATTPKGSSSGDPHFKTWTGEKFDYHGECDLVLVDQPSFNNGQGLRIHIRTTRVKYFSFIEKVAIQIGSDVLEFDNDAENFFINGEKVGENKQHKKTRVGGFVVRRDTRALSIRLLNDGRAGRQSGNIAKIDLHTRKNGFPAVIVDAGHTDIFAGSLGLLGEWGTGRKLARDGKTEIAVDPMDAAEFALEWQVRDTEPSLFMETRFPQFPNTCTPPAKMVMDRLGASLARKEAEEACAHWEFDKEDCIFDVLATRDILVAEEGHIVHIE